MENSWFYIDDDDDDDSSSSSLADSDKIDSDIEAELYSRLHHEPNLSFLNSDNVNEQSTGLLLYSASKDIFCANKQKNESKLVTNEHLLPNTNTDSSFSNEKRKSSEMDADCEILNDNLNSAKKFKTEPMCDGQSVNLDSNNYKNTNVSSKFTINDIQNKNIVCVSNNISNDKRATVKQESSDSDSDVWIEECSAEKSDLKINLLKDTDTIFLSSSDSDNELDISSPFGKRDSFLRNLSMPNIKTEENQRGLWHINFEDQRRSKKQYHRYHDNFDITCSNCNKKGHTFRTCPSPKVIKCFICGGNHMGFRCSKRICSNCHMIGHDRRNCQREIFKEFCPVCNMEGHGKGNCPDIWRRYHLTTDPFEFKRGRQIQQSTNLYCWNCGKYGHFGAVCPLPHLSRNSFSTLPCVISYVHPKRLLKVRLSFLKKNSFLNMVKLNRSTSNVSNASSKHENYRPDYKLNVSGGSNEGNKGNKKGGKKFRTAFRFDKIQDIVNGKDFPRTSKKSPNKFSNTVAKSEEGIGSYSLLIKRSFNELKKRWNQEFRRCGFLMEKNVSKALIEDYARNFDPNVPLSLKLCVERIFQRWSKNRLRNLNRKRNKAFRKGRELTE